MAEVIGYMGGEKVVVPPYVITDGQDSVEGPVSTMIAMRLQGAVNNGEITITDIKAHLNEETKLRFDGKNWHGRVT